MVNKMYIYIYTCDMRVCICVSFSIDDRFFIAVVISLPFHIIELSVALPKLCISMSTKFAHALGFLPRPPLA